MSQRHQPMTGAAPGVENAPAVQLRVGDEKTDSGGDVGDERSCRIDGRVLRAVVKITTEAVIADPFGEHTP